MKKFKLKFYPLWRFDDGRRTSQNRTYETKNKNTQTRKKSPINRINKREIRTKTVTEK